MYTIYIKFEGNFSKYQYISLSILMHRTRYVLFELVFLQFLVNRLKNDDLAFLKAISERCNSAPTSEENDSTKSNPNSKDKEENQNHLYRKMYKNGLQVASLHSLYEHIVSTFLIYTNFLCFNLSWFWVNRSIFEDYTFSLCS